MLHPNCCGDHSKDTPQRDNGLMHQQPNNSNNNNNNNKIILLPHYDDRKRDERYEMLPPNAPN